MDQGFRLSPEARGVGVESVSHLRGTDLWPPWQWPRAAYVHVPFCAHHCNYCDFAVAVAQEPQIELYAAALERELAATLGDPQPVSTLFLGGGTPTLLPWRQLERLLQNLNTWLPLETDPEFTVEANPSSLDADKVAVLADHGVNRISLGVQSFQPHLLRVLERDHLPEDISRAVDIIRRRIDHLAFDLIFAVPGQTLGQWQEDLDRALAFAPGHLSVYGLTYEKGTRLWKQRWRGEVQGLEEETELAMYEHAMDRLEAAGFEHYEISNFARPGQGSRHNLVYWANEAYFGFGMGAARYVKGRRELNTRNLGTYLRQTLAGQSAVFQSEALPPLERACETMALQLRRSRGIDRQSFQAQTGFDLDTLAGPILSQLVLQGLLEEIGASVRLTRRGKCLADAVVGKLLLNA